MIDIVDFIEQKAIAKGWQTVVADASSVNYELQNLTLTSGEHFLYITLPTIQRGKTNQLYNGDLTFRFELMLGRKCETETISSVAETAKQKYNNRLFELAGMLNDFISEVFDCSQEVEEMGTTEITMAKNIFAVSVDAVLTTITARAWNQ
jgi:hypothetical protein